MMSFMRMAVTVAPAFLLAGCSLLPIGRSTTVFGAGDGPVTIHVKNNNYNDASLWLITRDRRFRLGSVPGTREMAFTAPMTSPADSWHIEIDMVGGEWCQTDPLDVDPGDVLDLIIASSLANMPGCYTAGLRPRG
jgi:hypothetical protein